MGFTAATYFSVLALCVLSYALVEYHDPRRSLPIPTGVYYFRPNETQRVLEEAAKEAARMRQAVENIRLSGHTSRSLTAYHVAFPSEQPGLERIVDYVHLALRLWRANPSAKGLPTLQEVLKDPTVHQQLSEEELLLWCHLITPGVSKESKGQDQRHPGGPVKVHAVMSAGNGAASGRHELNYIYAAMRYSTQIVVAQCADVRFGFLEKPVRNVLSQHLTITYVPVLAVATGQYVARASACVASLTSLPMFVIQSATFLGTAGATPVVGGGGWHPTDPWKGADAKGGMGQARGAVKDVASGFWATPEGQEVAVNPMCQAEWSVQRREPSSRNTSHAPVAIGSVCVTHAALLQECGLCVEDTPVVSLCSRPRCHMHSTPHFFGQCDFAHPNKQFAEAMKGAMYGQPFPKPPEVVRRGMSKFWEANEAVPKYKAVQRAAVPGDSAEVNWVYQRNPPEDPVLLNCAEVSTNQILAGPRSDILCREYTHALLNKNESLYDRDDLTCVQAMEGIGFLHVMARYPQIPVAVVRGVAHYNMFPLRKRTWPLFSLQENGGGLDLLSKAEVLRGVGGGVADERQKKASETPTSVGGAAYQARLRMRSTKDAPLVRAALRYNAACDDENKPAASHVFTSWEQDPTFMDQAEYLAFTKASHQYAVETASAVVLNYFLRADTKLPEPHS